MRVTVLGADEDVSIEPYVDATPKIVLYDHKGNPLKRAIGFALDNRASRPVDSSLRQTRRKTTAGGR